jgi:mRNA-degrading endonuclease toxin of MazEF toxin-antitoxin module
VADFPRKFPRRGEIYWAPAGTKIRPVVIVSNDNRNQFANAVVVAAITTQLSDKEYRVNVSLPAGDPLDKAGEILCGSIYTLLKDDLRSYRAPLRPEQLAEVDAALKIALAL